jgi:hypothetical protein
MKQADFRDMEKDLQECLYSGHCGISWPSAFYTSNLFSYEDSRKHRRNRDDPEPADEGDIKIEYFSDTAQVW